MRTVICAASHAQAEIYRRNRGLAPYDVICCCRAGQNPHRVEGIRDFEVAVLPGFRSRSDADRLLLLLERNGAKPGAGGRLVDVVDVEQR